MYHLVYTSIATFPFTPTDLHQFLVWWRAYNTRMGLTGILLYSDEGEIMQVLEGEQLRVEELFASIEHDSRHRNVIKLAAGPIAHRMFGEWPMGFRMLNSAAFHYLTGYADPNESYMPMACTGVDTDTDLLYLLREFANARPNELPH